MADMGAAIINTVQKLFQKIAGWTWGIRSSNNNAQEKFTVYSIRRSIPIE